MNWYGCLPSRAAGLVSLLGQASLSPSSLSQASLSDLLRLLPEASNSLKRILGSATESPVTSLAAPPP